MIDRSIHSNATETETLNLRTHPDLNQLQTQAQRERDAFIATLLRTGVRRSIKALRDLLIPPVRPHRA